MSVVEGVDDTVLILTTTLLLSCVLLTFCLGHVLNREEKRVERAMRKQQSKSVSALRESERQRRKREEDASSETHAAAGGPNEEASTLPREALGELQCPVCLNTFQCACELVPCGHSFCGIACVLS